MAPSAKKGDESGKEVINQAAKPPNTSYLKNISANSGASNNRQPAYSFLHHIFDH